MNLSEIYDSKLLFHGKLIIAHRVPTKSMLQQQKVCCIVTFSYNSSTFSLVTKNIESTIASYKDCLKKELINVHFDIRIKCQ